MARRYWLKFGGQTYYAPTLADARRGAEHVARSLGLRAVVGYDQPKPRPRGRPRTRTYATNPDPMNFLGLWQEQERGRRARLDYLAKTKPARLAKGHQEREKAKTFTKPAFAIDVRNKREAYTLTQPSRAKANSLARQYEAAGYQVQVRQI